MQAKAGKAVIDRRPGFGVRGENTLFTIWSLALQAKLMVLAVLWSALGKRGV